jgi:hypothetical protein
MWRRNRDWQPEEVIAQQQAMNRQTWEVLKSRGVDEATELRLDFAYTAADRDRAEVLAAFLRAETDYEVRVDDAGVSGSTQSTEISPSILDEWVAWMVLAGFENGGCKFDGWGTAIPE